EFVEDGVGLTRGIIIQRRVWVMNRQHVNGRHFDVVPAPIARVLAQADAIIEPPCRQFVRAVGDHLTGPHHEPSFAAMVVACTGSSGVVAHRPMKKGVGLSSSTTSVRSSAARTPTCEKSFSLPSL